ncbi:hypothetical protein CEXT_318621 [Caerostris extrusa]|uniref:Uncharacterized protein n=1 Tax=Caerostris extrusa TaxID=172846 RepID=A0AAV4TX83_CAEEX|nr:hypothetical protein CEXT_318621 [Caerostris extrusa]
MANAIFVLPPMEQSFPYRRHTKKGSATPPLPEAQKITHGRRKQIKNQPREPYGANDISPKSPLGKEKRLIHARLARSAHICVSEVGADNTFRGALYHRGLTNSPCKTARSLGR